MTNLDNILNSRDITLLTKDHIVNATFFSSNLVWVWEWNHKDGWALNNWSYELWCWRRCFRILWTAKRSHQSTLKEINSEYSLEGLKLKLQYVGQLMRRAESLEKTLMLGWIEGRNRRGWQRMRWLDGFTDSVDIEFAQTPGVADGQGSLACCSPWGPKDLDTTEQPWCLSFLLLP